MNITKEQADQAAETLRAYVEQELAPAPIIEAAEQEDGTLFMEGRTVFWQAGTDEIELKGSFTLDELQAICTHVQDRNDAQEFPVCNCEECK